MHVLAATNNLYPEASATGSGRYNYEVGRRLAARGHSVSVITRQREDEPARGSVAGMDVYRYEASIPRLLSTLGEIEDLVASIQATEPVDVASFHGALSSLGVDRALPPSLPRAYTVHGMWGVEYEDRLVDPSRWAAPWHWLNRRVRHRIEGRVLGHSDALVVLSEFMRDRVAAHHPGAPPATVIPGGVDVDRFRPRGDDSSSGDLPAAFRTDGPTFLTVRRLTPRMGLETLLDAFASVVDAVPEATLVVGGDGPLREDLAARAERLGIDSAVTFLGYVPDEDLARTYAAADVFVLPTLELEGFGLVTLEALSAGTPVIGTGAGATPEILADLADRDSIPERLLVPAGDAAALGDAMAAWARLGDGERTEAGEASRSYVLETGYSWEAVTDEIETLLERLGNAPG